MSANTINSSISTGTGLITNGSISSNLWKTDSDRIISGGNLNLKTGDLILDEGDIILKTGDKLSERLERIESLLHIPTRDVKLEEKYAHLRELWEQYTHELEIIKMFETLQKD